MTYLFPSPRSSCALVRNRGLRACPPAGLQPAGRSDAHVGTSLPHGLDRVVQGHVVPTCCPLEAQEADLRAAVTPFGGAAVDVSGQRVSLSLSLRGGRYLRDR